MAAGDPATESDVGQPGAALWRDRLEPDWHVWYHAISVASPARFILCPISLASEGWTVLANSKSAEKRIRVSERRRMRNKPLRTQTRTYVKKAEAAIATDDQTAAAAEVLAAISKLDSVASKGVIHKNNAARRKSRLMAKYNAMLAQANA
jgi:small subunit ribosomal protein S20